MAVDRLTQALLQAELLSDPSSPKCCPVCLNLVAYSLHPLNHSTAKLPVLEKLRNHHHEFFTACMAFMTYPMDDASLPELRRALEANTANCVHRREHYREMKSNLPDPVHVVAEACYLAIYAALASGMQVPDLYSDHLINRAKPSSSLGAKHGRWPANIGQLYPRGEAESMDAHLFWCSQRFSPAPFTVLTVLLILARPHTFPHIVAESRRAQFVYLVCQMLYSDPSTIPSGWEGTLPIPVSPAVVLDSPLAAPNQYMQQLNEAADFLHAIDEGIDANVMKDLVSFYRGYETVVFQAVHTATARMDVRHQSFKTVCYSSAVLCETAGVPRSGLHPRVRAFYGLDGSLTRNREEDSPLSRPRLTLTYLQHLARVRNCNGPRCTKTVFEDGRPFPVCARCKTVRYCGPECQKRDWSSAELEHRHKDICPLLRRLLCTAEIGTADFKTNRTLPKTGRPGRAEPNLRRSPLGGHMQPKSTYQYVLSPVAATRTLSSASSVTILSRLGVGSVTWVNGLCDGDNAHNGDSRSSSIRSAQISPCISILARNGTRGSIN